MYPSLYSHNTLSFTTVNNEEMTKVTDHMANERTYLAWVRTGITIMALGFVVAKFGIIIRELVPNAPATSYHLSSAIGIALVIAGGFMQVLALRSFLRNRASIENRESKIVDLCEQRDDGTRTYMLVIAPEACEGG